MKPHAPCHRESLFANHALRMGDPPRSGDYVTGELTDKGAKGKDKEWEIFGARSTSDSFGAPFARATSHFQFTPQLALAPAKAILFR